MRVGAQASCHEDSKARLHGAVIAVSGRRHNADVIEHRLTAVGVTTRKVDLELPRETLSERVAHEVLVGGLGPRGYVEDLEGTCASQVAPLHIADGVTTGFARGETDRCEVPHDLGDLVQLSKVELQILTGRDVPPPTAVGVDEISHHVQLVRRHRAVGHLHPHHLVGPALTLTVDAVGQAEYTEYVLVEIASQVLGQLYLELRDVVMELARDHSRVGT